MSKIKTLLSFTVSLSLISCQTITVSPEGKTVKLTSPPDYRQTQHFFLGGLIGEAVVPAGEICGEKPVAQMQSQTTFLDGLWPNLILATVMVTASVIVGVAVVADGPENLSAAEFFGGAAVIGLVSGLAASIYTPKTAKVWCGEKPAVSPAQNNKPEGV